MPEADHDEALSVALEGLTSAHRYRRWLAGQVRPWMGPDAVEIGSGTGDYAAEWAGQGLRLTASEASPADVGALEKRFSSDPAVAVRHIALPCSERGEHSSAVALNVIEHIDDDVGAVRSMAGLVRPGGNVVLVVPAFQFATGGFDRKIGHHRRYRKAEVVTLLEAAGLEPVHARYLNAPGLVAWVVLIKWLGRDVRDSLGLRFYDRFVIPVAAAIERVVRVPFGQSVVAVGRVRP